MIQRFSFWVSVVIIAAALSYTASTILSSWIASAID